MLHTFRVQVGSTSSLSVRGCRSRLYSGSRTPGSAKLVTRLAEGFSASTSCRRSATSTSVPGNIQGVLLRSLNEVTMMPIFETQVKFLKSTVDPGSLRLKGPARPWALRLRVRALSLRHWGGGSVRITKEEEAFMSCFASKAGVLLKRECPPAAPSSCIAYCYMSHGQDSSYTA